MVLNRQGKMKFTISDKMDLKCDCVDSFNHFAPGSPNPEKKIVDTGRYLRIRRWQNAYELHGTALNNAPAGSIQCTEGFAASPRSTGVVCVAQVGPGRQ